ncbi:MAG: hypothetical protein HQL80_08515 [Magnetococcales bacterium]|nr:hypothetical protein [Magnetococcales bacterium]
MKKSFSLTLKQVDAINLSLTHSLAIAQIVAECGGTHLQSPSNPQLASLFVVMQVLLKELENIGNVIEGLKKLK